MNAVIPKYIAPILVNIYLSVLKKPTKTVHNTFLLKHNCLCVLCNLL